MIQCKSEQKRVVPKKELLDVKCNCTLRQIEVGNGIKCKSMLNKVLANKLF